ncbi:MAG: hypothetical protein EBY16_04890 [Gammaproteobacteria bacterium]|nr:hypothetical protein [Gammaproteobacteria bacterium]
MKTSVALKLDFKIDEKGILRIFDIGDGLGAGIKGFDRIALHTTMLNDLCAANNSALAPIFGELPLDAMSPETMHLPIIQRKVSAERSWFDISDLSESDCGAFLPYSYAWRIQSTLSHFWGKKLASVATTPIGLMSMEMHKLLWYILIQKHMPIAHRDNVLFWSNDNAVAELDLSTIDMTNGVFIKIGDRSTGGGNEVHYAKNASAVTRTLRELHQLYLSSNDTYKNHIYIIEPAYLTLKLHDSEDYNVTGRAYVTLTLDTETRELHVKIAGAKWIFPMEPLQEQKTQQQMLANVGHSHARSPFLDLNTDELGTLAQQIVAVYGDIFAASIEHVDLIEYCQDAPIVRKFKSILRPDSGYKLMLESNKLQASNTYGQQENMLMVLINSYIFRDYLDPSYLQIILASEDKKSCLFSITAPKDLLITKICALSFLERYAQFIKTCPEPYRAYDKVTPILSNETLISLTLNALIKRVLQIKDKMYDFKDFNRALRQAASVSDMEVMKLLIGTHRVSVNACSPKTQQTALDFALKSEAASSIKESCIQLLRLNGAKSMQLQAESAPTESKALQPGF